MTRLTSAFHGNAWSAAAVRWGNGPCFRVGLGSWWGHYGAWLAEHSGEQIAAPQFLGSARYPPIEPAPGSYIHL